ncbi:MULTISPECIES: NAD(P)-dependent alcohol dehydrogenase [unclassified Saccharopolyspora]|uniref:NAD(P)-dependent alcohol dehydrogenase n=1 Tax=unclassified Saccharopolyspora TaxID=2646250 RepID=UPI001CD4CFDE|nr:MULTISPECIES: NAD(P)-dependent alcohol dehydrogenase [unclassified Saccharopolyspora]MCA1189895.1 NAD(P)-dependent alcohol dehydrogenase [Saccharopolyspora sp. 6T]MCA1191185.1 NAD(P)-dependent alcohol dehydrogenase [Saccharopolyspora sp. 6V]MCA1229283.1 NAD(P)-dependent alcohol dehydrogenase [Saccharopolyspora sp. 6M]MCA1282876.1 NAD(P)-dependent alcohol dehydrogenase [Saccharopolyspora sp. 7B]
MRAVRVHAYGERPVVESVPDPAVREPLDVLVEVGAAGVCRTDLHIIEGQWADKSGVALPYIIGHENAGTVREVGSAVSNVRPGDKVILHPLVTCGLCRPCRGGDDVHCENSLFPGIDTDGGMAELLRTNARSVVKLDDGLEPAEVAALADAGLTAYHAVRKAVPLLHPGAHVVVIGAGGLGHIGLQSLVALTPAEITVVDRSPEALRLAEQLGAHHAVRADGGQVDAVRDITGGKGAEVVLDFVGENGTEADGIAMTRDAGSYFVIGYGGRLDVPTIDVISREINVVGNLVGSYLDLDELMTLTAQGKVSLRTRTYPLDAALDALDDLDSGRIPGGRAILVP